jgi:tRNA threonylcarbamoyladenosine biosynthesis protein TsaB
MIVMGLDTSTRATAVGLTLLDGSAVQARDDPEGEERPGHATRLLPLADRLLVGAGLGWGDIERIAVGVGPGTFTGLRIGVASARGLAQSLGVGLVGVSSLRALAYAMGSIEPAEPAGADGLAATNGAAGANELSGADEPRAPGELGGVLAVIDARRGEAFAAAYHGDVEVLAPEALTLAGLGELRGRARARTGVARWTAIGDGALRYRTALEQAGVLVLGDRSSLHRVDARAICQLGMWDRAHEAQILPEYVRRPDAEIALEGAPSQ